MLALVFFLQIILTVRSENVLTPIFQFILSNEDICGDPFRDPNWLPALEECQIDCDISSQICEEHTGKTYPGQRCSRLPLNCSRQIKKMLHLDPDMPAIQLPLAPLSTFAITTPPPTAPPRLPSFVSSKPLFSEPMPPEHVVNRDVAMPMSAPMMPGEVPPLSYSPDSPNSIVGSSDNFDVAPPSLEPLPPAYFPETTPPPPPPAMTYMPTEQESIQMSFSPAPRPPAIDYEDERNVETMPAPAFATAPGEFDISNQISPKDELFGPPANAYPPVMMRPNTAYGSMPMMSSSRSVHSTPLSWTDLNKKLKRRPFYSIEDSGTVFDYSVRCCQWALDGLCDRSWQRVRQLCPKSCGTVVCASVEGALSCNRAVDVDVLDCFQRSKLFAMQAAVTHTDTFHSPFDGYRSKPKPKPKLGRAPKTYDRRAYSMAHVFSVENEIRQFHFNSNF